MRYKKNILFLLVIILFSLGIWYCATANNRNDIGGKGFNGGTIDNELFEITADKEFKKARLKVFLQNLESKEDLHYKVTNPNNEIVIEGIVKSGEEFNSGEIVMKWIGGDWVIELNKNDNAWYEYKCELKFTNR